MIFIKKWYYRFFLARKSASGKAKFAKLSPEEKVAILNDMKISDIARIVLDKPDLVNDVRIMDLDSQKRSKVFAEVYVNKANGDNGDNGDKQKDLVDREILLAGLDAAKVIEFVKEIEEYVQTQRAIRDSQRQNSITNYISHIRIKKKIILAACAEGNEGNRDVCQKCFESMDAYERYLTVEDLNAKETEYLLNVVKEDDVLKVMWELIKNSKKTDKVMKALYKKNNKILDLYITCVLDDHNGESHEYFASFVEDRKLEEDVISKIQELFKKDPQKAASLLLRRDANLDNINFRKILHGMNIGNCTRILEYMGVRAIERFRKEYPNIELPLSGEAKMKFSSYGIAKTLVDQSRENRAQIAALELTKALYSGEGTGKSQAATIFKFIGDLGLGQEERLDILKNMQEMNAVELLNASEVKNIYELLSSSAKIEQFVLKMNPEKLGEMMKLILKPNDPTVVTILSALSPKDRSEVLKAGGVDVRRYYFCTKLNSILGEFDLRRENHVYIKDKLSELMTECEDVATPRLVADALEKRSVKHFAIAAIATNFEKELKDACHFFKGEEGYNQLPFPYNYKTSFDKYRDGFPHQYTEKSAYVAVQSMRKEMGLENKVPPQQYAPQQYPPQQPQPQPQQPQPQQQQPYPPLQYPPQQYAPQQYPPQYAPQQYPPQQYPPQYAQQYPPQQYYPPQYAQPHQQQYPPQQYYPPQYAPQQCPPIQYAQQSYTAGNMRVVLVQTSESHSQQVPVLSHGNVHPSVNKSFERR